MTVLLAKPVVRHIESSVLVSYHHTVICNVWFVFLKTQAPSEEDLPENPQEAILQESFQMVFGLQGDLCKGHLHTFTAAALLASQV